MPTRSGRGKTLPYIFCLPFRLLLTPDGGIGGSQHDVRIGNSRVASDNRLQDADSFSASVGQQISCAKIKGSRFGNLALKLPNKLARRNRARRVASVQQN